MSEEANLNEIVVSAMKESGKFGKVSAEIRATIYKILTKDMEYRRSTPVCRENLVINELIREYLQFNGFENTLSVFVPETGQPSDPMNREFLAHNLGLFPKDQMPLMNTLVKKWRNSEAPEHPPTGPRIPVPNDTIPERQHVVIPTDLSDSSDGFFEIRS